MKLRLLVLFFITCLFNTLYPQYDSNTVLTLQEKLRPFQENDQIDSIWFYENKALAISQKISYNPGIAHAYGSFGVIYKIKGNYPLALDNFFKALAIYEKTHNEYWILVQYSGIASVYYLQKNYDKAKSYYNKALVLSRKIHDKRIESDNLCNLALLYGETGQYEQAKECLEKALKIDTEMGNEIGMVHELANLGELYNTLKQYSNANDCAIKAIALAEKNEYPYILPSCYMIIGQVKESLKQNSEAESYFLKAMKMAAGFDDMQDKMKIASGLSQFYANTGKPALALQYYKQEIQYRDSMYNEENVKKTVELEMNYEFEKKQAAQQFENDKKVYQLEAENKLQRQWRAFFVAMIVLAIAALIFAKRAYDNKKKVAKLMSDESSRKEVLLQEIHHRINNNLQIISSLLTLQANSADNEKLSEYLLQSQNRIQSLSLSHELLYESNTSMEINMKDYINKILIYHREIVASLPKKIEIRETVETVLFPSRLAVPLALIINELVTNAVKYAFTDQDEGLIQVTLSTLDNNNNWLITVSDNGKGLPDVSQNRKDSLGLKLTGILTRQIKGVFNSKNEGGAFFSISFSKNQA